MEETIHSATRSAIGYYYQGYYALVVLMDCDDDRASISVETRDDIELESNSIISLKQLKHKHSRLINLKSDDFWNTVAIWCQYVDEDHIHFQYVSTGAVKPDDPLLDLVRPTNLKLLPDRVIKQLAIVFRAEAERVKLQRQKKESENKKPGYEKRWPGCRAFLSLNNRNQEKLISRIWITPDEFQATDIQNEVEKRLRLVPPRIRGRVANRLIEWWDRRVAMGLLKQKNRKIENSELMEMTSGLIADFEEERLIDDFQDIPLPSKIPAPSNMVRQIELINAGKKWINRAKEVRWLAKSQRDKWLKDGPYAIDKLDKFDKNLIKEWEYRYEDYQEKYISGLKEANEVGQDILKWSFYNAPKDVPPIQDNWRSPYLVRGTYQDMANSLTVGWHPEYERIFQELENGNVKSDD